MSQCHRHTLGRCLLTPSDSRTTINLQNGVDYDNKTQESAIYKILGDNKGWNKNVDGSEKGVFDYLMSANIDVSHPIVREELINWGKWIIRETGTDGFRFDAVRHIDEKFLSEFVRAVREDQDNVSHPFCQVRFICGQENGGLTLVFLPRFPPARSLRE